MNVDFSKAPGWAIGHALHAFGGEIREVWVGEHQYQRLDQPKPFPYGGGNSDHRHNPRRSEFHFEQLRPVLWAGEGLPPVGMVCEAHRLGGIIHPEHRWMRVQILAHWTEDDRLGPVAIYMPLPGSNPGVAQGIETCFRPIRTPEQIAAEEREAELNRMVATVSMLDKGWARNVCAGLYDAGYRKQVQS